MLNKHFSVFKICKFYDFIYRDKDCIYLLMFLIARLIEHMTAVVSNLSLEHLGAYTSLYDDISIFVRLNLF